MGIGARDNEFRSWQGLAGEQKSYTVRVLNWFHYRPTATGRSWTREEVLTWEVLRALDLLPRDLFLGPLLQMVRTTGGDPHPTAALLAGEAAAVVVDPFPSLGLSGPRRNRRSDIGLDLPNRASLWIEAKTARCELTALSSQLHDQADALGALSVSRAYDVVALLPDDHETPDWPTIRWSNVDAALTCCRAAILDAPVPDSFRRGFVVLASELQARLRGHTPRLLPSAQR